MENTADEWSCYVSANCSIHSNLQEFIISVFIIEAIGLICGSQLNCLGLPRVDIRQHLLVFSLVTGTMADTT